MLPLSVECDSRPGYLYARLRGFRSRSHSAGVMEAIKSHARRHGHDRILVDVRGVAGTLAAADHAEIGARFGVEMAGYRCASLLDRWQYTGAGLAAARQAGLTARAFFDEQEAVDWLLGGAP